MGAIKELDLALREVISDVLIEQGHLTPTQAERVVDDEGEGEMTDALNMIFKRVGTIVQGERQVQMTGPDEFGSVYVYVRSAQEDLVTGNTIQHKGMVNLDYNDKGDLIGIELLDVQAKYKTNQSPKRRNRNAA